MASTTRKIVNISNRMVVFKNPEDGQEYHCPPKAHVLIPVTDTSKLPKELKIASPKGN